MNSTLTAIASRTSVPRILVVDDERIVAEDISESLQHMGFEVIGTAQSGPQAIEMALSMRPDLIMMDIVLQGEMDGVQAAAIIREKIDTPCVFLTAYSDPGVLERAKATEPAGYIVKPFEEAGLRSTVEIALYKVKAEQALRQSREWFSTTLMSISEGVIATNAGGVIQIMNPEAEKLTGWNSKDVVGRHLGEIFRIFNHATNAGARNAAIDALQQRTIIQGESNTILQRADGQTISIDHSGAPIMGSDGQIAGAVLVFRDVTRARHAENELLRYKDHLEELVQERTSEMQKTNEQLTSEVKVRRRAERALEYRVNMQNLVGSISSDFLNLRLSDNEEGMKAALSRIGEFLKVSSTFVFEYSEDGKFASMKHIWSEDPRLSRTRRFFQKLSTDKFPWWQLQANNQNYIYVRSPEELPAEALNEREIMRSYGTRGILAVPMREGSRLLGFFGLHTTDTTRAWVKEDLTFLQMCSDILLSALTRKRSEEEKERLQLQLAHSQKMEAIGKLSGGIAHDFNNMLLPIIGYSDMLLDTLDPEDPRSRDIIEIRKAAERAAGLTRQLLAFSKKQVISKSVFDLNDAIRNIESMLKPTIGEDIALSTHLAPAGLSVKADIGQIEQVIMNLVINARDAMKSGGSVSVRTGLIDASDEALSLISETQPRGHYVFVEVTDTGCGMDEELVARVFEPFYTTKGLDGTGLGLSVVYGILEQHKGGISVQSVPGQGTTFRVFLPASTQVAPVLASKTGGVERVKFRGKGQRILLVEDELGVAKFVSEALRQNGYVVTIASSLREARGLFAEHQGEFEMIFSDAVLPDGNGIELLEALLSAHPEIKGILSSGYTDKHNVNEMLRHRAIEFLQKPYSLPILVSTVGEMMGKIEVLTA
jgi:two-component system cell cycle sensor histidine kinase/response regulator CckA